MAVRKFNFVAGEYYHIYNRGTDKRIIFNDASDYGRFQHLLYLANDRKNIKVREILKQCTNVYMYKRDELQVAIGAYCLMPNHFHILLSPMTDDGVVTFMRKLMTSYSMYFNKKYDRRGGLYEGIFKAQHCTEDRYLKHLYSYIHLNPVKLLQPDWKEVGIKDKKKTKEKLLEYPYSSWPDYTGIQRRQGRILNFVPFPKYYLTASDAEREALEWLNINSP